MNINKTDLDSLNSVINMTIDRKDYEEKVSTVLSNYRKNANIPGFRKGHVPMGMIKKQYEQAVIADEVNKLLRENLSSENFLAFNAISFLRDIDIALKDSIALQIDKGDSGSNKIPLSSSKIIG